MGRDVNNASNYQNDISNDSLPKSGSRFSILNLSKYLLVILLVNPGVRSPRSTASEISISFSNEKLTDRQYKSKVENAFLMRNYISGPDSVLSNVISWKKNYPKSTIPDKYIIRLIDTLRSLSGVNNISMMNVMVNKLYGTNDIDLIINGPSDNLKSGNIFGSNLKIVLFPEEFFGSISELSSDQVKVLDHSFRQKIEFMYRSKNWTRKDDSATMLSLYYIRMKPNDEFGYIYLERIYNQLNNGSSKYSLKNSYGIDDFQTALFNYLGFVQDQVDINRLLKMCRGYEKGDNIQDITHKYYVELMDVSIKNSYDQKVWTDSSLIGGENIISVLDYAVTWINDYPMDERPYSIIEDLIKKLKNGKNYTTNNTNSLKKISQSLEKIINVTESDKVMQIYNKYFLDNGTDL